MGFRGGRELAGGTGEPGISVRAGRHDGTSMLAGGGG